MFQGLQRDQYSSIRLVENDQRLSQNRARQRLLGIVSQVHRVHHHHTCHGTLTTEISAPTVAYTRVEILVRLVAQPRKNAFMSDSD